MLAKRRSQGNAFGVPSLAKVNRIKQFNKEIRYVQGFRQQLNGSTTTPVTISLTASGKFLLGISIVPVGTGDISDTQISFIVNNNNLLNTVAAQNLNPNFVQGDMEFFPLPQPLQGNDTIQANFLKNDANTVNIILNIFYIPRL